MCDPGFLCRVCVVSIFPWVEWGWKSKKSNLKFLGVCLGDEILIVNSCVAMKSVCGLDFIAGVLFSISIRLLSFVCFCNILFLVNSRILCEEHFAEIYDMFC